MARKTTRQRKEIAQQRAIQQAAANVAQAASRPSAPAAAASISSNARPAEDAGDVYPYVRADLRRIAILAIGMIAILVALSLVIR